MKRQNLLGFILVGLGIYFLLLNTGVLGGDFFLLFLAAAFIAAYFALGRNLGMLIPGTVIGAIGTFSVVEDAGIIPGDGGPLFLLFLGIAFLLVWLIHTLPYGEGWGGKNWPLFPGGILALLGVAFYIEDNLSLRERLAPVAPYWPLILIAVGVWVLWQNSRGRGSAKSGLE